MTINTQTLADDIAREFGVSSGSVRFADKFFNAVSKVLIDYQCFSTEEVSSPTDLYTDISLDAKYKNFLYDGVIKYLNDSGEWGVDPKADVDVNYRISLGNAQMLYLRELAPSVRIE